MAGVYMPPMEAADFARWAAEALHRAGWNVEITIQLHGDVLHVVRGEVARYSAEELAEAKREADALAIAARKATP